MLLIPHHSANSKEMSDGLEGRFLDKCWRTFRPGRKRRRKTLALDYSQLESWSACSGRRPGRTSSEAEPLHSGTKLPHAYGICSTRWEGMWVCGLTILTPLSLDHLPFALKRFTYLTTIVIFHWLVSHVKMWISTRGVPNITLHDMLLTHYECELGHVHESFLIEQFYRSFFSQFLDKIWMIVIHLFIYRPTSPYALRQSLSSLRSHRRKQRDHPWDLRVEQP